MGKRRTRKASPRQSPTTPTASRGFLLWLRSGWTIASATFGLLIAAVLNGPALLQSARTLPDELSKTLSQWRSWKHSDSEWSGYWNSFPEGLINISDMRLSNVDLEVTIWAKEGRLDGVIATKAICRQFPFWDYVLLRGEINGDTAEVVAFDFIEGNQVDFATLSLRREGGVLIVKPTGGKIEWFPREARIGRNPRAPDAEITADMEYCSEENKAFMEALRQHTSSDRSER